MANGGSRSQESSTTHAAVAIDKDKNSQFAVKWAIDNLNLSGYITLLHVHTQSAQESVPKEGRAPTQDEQKQFFLPYRGFCARKRVRANEVVLHDSNVASALAEYVIDNNIGTIVLGASSRSALTRAFKNLDVQGDLIRSIPDFCSVYVVSKSKSQLMKMAKRSPNPHSSRHHYNSGFMPESPLSEHLYSQGSARSVGSDRSANSDAESQVMYSSSGHSVDSMPGSARNGYNSRNHFQQHHSGNNDEVAQMMTREMQSGRSNNSLFSGSYDFGNAKQSSTYSRTSSPGHPMASGTPTSASRTPASKIPPSSYASSNNLNFYLHNQENPSGTHSGSSDHSGQSSFLSSVTSFEIPEHSHASDVSRISPPSPTTVEMEDEMKSLKQELKHTMDIYNSACNEATTAKEKAMEFNKWKSDEERKAEESKHAQEAALVMMEMEKAKCKAAIEAAQIAQRIAELESQKRKHAEMKFLHEAEEKKKAIDALARWDGRYRKYTIDEIEAATDHFSAKEKIGEGGYGPVYKGYLGHTAVAIKVLRPDISQGKIQFQREIEVLCRLRHPNMVLLLGACPEYGCLVYEFMGNGSLEDRLFCRNGCSPLPWRIRFRIAAEVATALLFLHQTKPEPLVHRDLKPANILIDRNFVSKIGDVGLSRLVPSTVADSVTQYHMTAAAGTFCYIDPEYQQSGMLGTKSDIYSLGVVLLQIITAKPAMGLTYQVEEAIEQGTFANTLDPKIPDWPVEEALSLAKLALKCCELRKRDRPDLGTVILPELERLRDLGSKAEGRGESLNKDQSNLQNQVSQESISFSLGPSSNNSEYKTDNQSR